MNSLRGVELLNSVKRTAHLKRYHVALPPPAESYRLAPVSTEAGHLNPEEVRCLTDWRNRHVRAFVSEFREAEEHTDELVSFCVGLDSTAFRVMLEEDPWRNP